MTRLLELRGVGLFRSLPEHALATLADAAQRRSLQRGDILFPENMPATAVHVLTSGFVKIRKTGRDGARATLAYFGPGEPLGIAALIQGRTYAGDAVAASDVTTLHWPAPVFKELVCGHTDLALELIALLEHRLRSTQEQLKELTSEPVEQRMAQALLRLCNELSPSSQASFSFPFPLTLQDVADLTGTTLSTASRILSAWEQRGAIERGRERIRIVNRNASLWLMARSDGFPVPPRRTRRPSTGL